jgi:hypothetical protein
MVTERNAYVDSSLSQYAALDDDRVTRTAAALEGNGIGVLRASDAREARRIVLERERPLGEQARRSRL